MDTATQKSRKERCMYSPPTSVAASPLDLPSIGTATTTELKQKSKSNKALAILACIACQGYNGKWVINYDHLLFSGVRLVKKRRCKKCKVRCTYVAGKRKSDGEVDIVSVLDKSGMRDLAKTFGVTYKEVKEVHDSLREERRLAGSPEGEETSAGRVESV